MRIVFSRDDEELDFSPCELCVTSSEGPRFCEGCYLMENFRITMDFVHKGENK